MILFLNQRRGSETLTLLKPLGRAQFSSMQQGLQFWEANASQRAALWPCLTGCGTARRLFPFCSTFVLQQFPWCPCFVCRLVCRQHSSWTCHTRFYEAVHLIAWLHWKAVAQPARQQLPQIPRRLSLGCIFRKYTLTLLYWRGRYRWCCLSIQLSLLLVTFGKLK